MFAALALLLAASLVGAVAAIVALMVDAIGAVRAFGLRFRAFAVFCRRWRGYSYLFRRFLGGLARSRMLRGVASFLFSLVAGPGLPVAVVCFRYRLPNFPHSPAGDGRARQGLHILLADSGESPLCVRLVEFVHLCGDHQV